MDQLIGSYAGVVINTDEFKPHLAGFRQHLTRLQAEREAAAAHDAKRSLQLVIGRLEEFAGRVRAGLDGLDWHDRREVIRAVARRIVVFRIPGAAPPPSGDGGAATRSGRVAGPASRLLFGNVVERAIDRLAGDAETAAH